MRLLRRGRIAIAADTRTTSPRTSTGYRTGQRDEHRNRGRISSSLPASGSCRSVVIGWVARGVSPLGPAQHPRLGGACDDPAIAAGPSAVAGAGAGAGAGETISRERVLDLNTQAADYFTAQATPSSKGGQYLERRLGADVVNDDRWRLGYAPEGWTNLTDHLRGAGASDAEIVGSGLGLRSSRGNVVDAFRDRATVGIRDDRGDDVGFVGRRGSPQAPKYVNTGGTPACTKGDHVLGLHEAGANARLVRVEGPFDAIATTAAGQGRYAGVAPLGTALTETQASAIADRAGARCGRHSTVTRQARKRLRPTSGRSATKAWTPGC